MIFIKPVVGDHDIETREHIEEAFSLAAQKARDRKESYGLFCANRQGRLFRFASVNDLAWAAYGNQ